MIAVRLLAAGILFVIAVALSVVFVALSLSLALDVYGTEPSVELPASGSLPLPIVATTVIAVPVSLPTATATLMTLPIITPLPQCDPSYPTICLRPSISKTLSCADIPYKNFPVFAPDPQQFDRDGDGVGCEK